MANPDLCQCDSPNHISTEVIEEKLEIMSSFLAVARYDAHDQDLAGRLNDLLTEVDDLLRYIDDKNKE